MSSAGLTYSLAFLFSRNRLNVAISRAQCARLSGLFIPLEELDLVNARCRLAEYAQEKVI